MDDADRGRVLSTGVPGVCVSEVLLEERDAELVFRLGVDVDVDRGSFGELFGVNGKELLSCCTREGGSFRSGCSSSGEGSTTIRFR